MATETKPEGLPDLDDLLQCPVCYEIPTGQIFQCNEGHHVCGRCKARLALCPVCRAFFFGTRNYAMEELIANVRKLQAFKLGGKMTVTSGSGASESTASADNSVAGVTLEGSVEDEDVEELSGPNVRAPAACKGLFRCLCCKNGNSERLPAARLLNHLRYYHSRDLIEGKTEGGEYVQAWQIPTVPGRIVIAVRVADMGIFFLVIEISEDVIYSWVSMAAAPWVAHEFMYTVTISGNDREAIFTDCVWSVRSCEGALKKRGRCLVVSGSDARALTATPNISGRITLRRAPDDQVAQPAQPRAFVRVANRGGGGGGPAFALGATFANAAVITPPPRPNDIQPLINHLQNNVDRLTRAFASLGQEASALVRQEAQLQANARSANRALNQATLNTLRHNAEAQVPQPATAAGVSNNENSQLSRNARRRLRKRLRGALDNSQAAADTSSQNGIVQGRPQQGTLNAAPQSQRQLNNNAAQQPRRQPVPNSANQEQPQQPRAQSAQTFVCPMAILNPVETPSGSSGPSQNDNRPRSNKKKRNQRW